MATNLLERILNADTQEKTNLAGIYKVVRKKIKFEKTP